MSRYHHFIHESKFSGQSGSVRLSDGRSVTWTASGRIGTTPKYGGYPVDATIHHGETVLFDGTAADANEWLAKHGACVPFEDAPIPPAEPLPEPIFFDAPAFTVVGLHGDGSPFVQTFRCGSATRAVEVVNDPRFVATQRYGGVRVVAVFPGVQIPDESWRQQADGETSEARTAE